MDLLTSKHFFYFFSTIYNFLAKNIINNLHLWCAHECPHTHQKKAQLQRTYFARTKKCVFFYRICREL